MNRAQRRAAEFRKQQRQPPTSSPDSKATIAVSGAARSVCLALGLEVDADGNVELVDDPLTNGELGRCFVRVSAALKTLEAPSFAFARDLTSASGRELVAVVLAYNEVFDAEKAMIERLKAGTGSDPVEPGSA
jgi:hypothetical protein